MHSIKTRLSLIVLVCWLAACDALPQNVTININEPTRDVNQIVQATLQAMTAQASIAQPQATPVAQATSAPGLTPTVAAPAATTGSISGQLNYPAEAIPAQEVFAYQVGGNNYQYVITNPGQGTYRIIDLPPGKYHVIAYSLGTGGATTGLAAGYTNAVTCGLGAGCTDHALIDVTVAAGKDSGGIDPVDWYAPQGSFPAFPQGPQASGTLSTTPMDNIPPMGTITGTLMYPASALPAMRIAAFDVTLNQYSYTDTQPGQNTYSLGVAVGKYHVFAYPLGVGSPGLAGGYTKAVPCGLTVACTDHSLIDVTVTANNTITGVDPNDWYAPAGNFPAMPGQ